MVPGTVHHTPVSGLLYAIGLHPEQDYMMRWSLVGKVVHQYRI
jgi:hypothetical protein